MGSIILCLVSAVWTNSLKQLPAMVRPGGLMDYYEIFPLLTYSKPRARLSLGVSARTCLSQWTISEYSLNVHRSFKYRLYRVV